MKEPGRECLYAAPTGMSALRRRLELDGWLVQTDSTGIHVINPKFPALEERITLTDRMDGRWFAYGWGQAFAPSSDIEMAVKSIRRVLGSLSD